jgi:tetratricopeptide (TPR) repeat protein
MNEATIRRGYEALRSKDLRKAHEIFKVIIKDPEDRKELYDALLGLSLTYRELGQLDEAIETSSKAIKSNSNPKEALFNLGNYYEEKGEHALAIQNFDLAITIDPNFSDAYVNRGVAWYNLEKNEQAKRDFKNGLDNDKRSTKKRNMKRPSTISIDLWKKIRKTFIPFAAKDWHCSIWTSMTNPSFVLMPPYR